MKTFDELFPAPLHVLSLLWAVDWTEMDQGLPLSEQLWEHEACNMPEQCMGGASTLEAVQITREFIDALAFSESGHVLQAEIASLYHDYRIVHDAAYKEDYNLTSRIRNAIEEGLMPRLSMQRVTMEELPPAAYKTMALFEEALAA